MIAAHEVALAIREPAGATCLVEIGWKKRDRTAAVLEQQQGRATQPTPGDFPECGFSGSFL
jgi:hypothetical protein